MFFREFIETCQSIAICNKLYPSDEANWHYICREYSKTFHTPLHEVLKLNPEFTCTQLFSEQFNRLDLEEQEDLETVSDIINSLKDPEYDIKKEKALRDELKRYQEEEKLRLEEGRSIHHTLDAKGNKLPNSQIVKNKTESKQITELPKEGGINMDLIRQLQNDGNDNRGNF